MNLFYRNDQLSRTIKRLSSKRLGIKPNSIFFAFLSLAVSAAAFSSGPELDQALKQEQQYLQEPKSQRVEIVQAKAILVKKTTNDAAIEVKLFEDVTWRNGAMGCPKPDGIYTQALIKGYRIILIAENREYAFHGREKGAPFYCESPNVALK